MILDCAGKPLDLSAARIMGILNVTPDSFSDGGKFVKKDAAIAQAQRMIAEGADILDIGGESTRPGAKVVPIAEEIERVVPVIEAIAAEIDVPISIDTHKPEVMRAAVEAGAGLINDINALRTPGALEAAANLAVPVCLMHMQGTPQTMQNNPHYDDVVSEVESFLLTRAEACLQAGIHSNKIILDPGFGFGKRARHNLRLMKHLSRLTDLPYPLLVGVSRKSIIGDMLNVSVDERLAGSLSLATIAVWQGAKLIRTHDVQATMQAVKLCEHVKQVEDID
jgi:dihydropteroate synthase